MGLFGNNEIEIKIKYSNKVKNLLSGINDDILDMANKINENTENHFELQKELNEFYSNVVNKVEDENDENSLFKLDRADMTKLMNLAFKYLEHHKKVEENNKLVLNLMDKQVNRSNKTLDELENF